MRIISGKFKGRRFEPPANITARPTTDFAKESLFNLINNRMEIAGTTCLDLFAGTGSISYELVSREALHVTSIEMSERQLAYMRKMIKDLKIDNMRIMRMDVFRFLESSSKGSYDFIFADPPYQLEKIEEIPNKIFENNLLNPDGIFILEHGSRMNFEEHPYFSEHRNYGNVHFTFFEHKEQ